MGKSMMKPPVRAAAALAVTVSLLAGCMTQPAAPTDMVTAGVPMQSAFGATAAPSPADQALTCPELATEIARLQARYDALEAEHHAEQQRQSLVSGGINLGATILGGSLLANAGSAQSIQTVGTGLNLARSGAMAAANQQSGSAQITAVGEASAIAQRLSQLQRIQFAKNCAA